MPETVNYLFAYGSLVERATKGSGFIWPADLTGFSRAWRHCMDTEWGKVCALTIVARHNARVRGVLIPITEDELAALDVREIGYVRGAIDRSHLSGLSIPSSGTLMTYFSRKEHLHPGSEKYPIWRSYVDYILAYYIEVFGIDSAKLFISETVGWEAPMLDDRHAPKYPRAKTLAPSMRALVDDALASAGIS